LDRRRQQWRRPNCHLGTTQKRTNGDDNGEKKPKQKEASIQHQKQYDSGCETVTTKDLQHGQTEELVRMVRVAIPTVTPPQTYIYMVAFRFGLEGKRRGWKLEGGGLLERRSFLG